MHESLTEVLNTALDMIQAGESVEVCLARFPKHAEELEPLLRLSAALNTDAHIPLPPEMEAWLSVGAQEFAAITAHEFAPASPPLPSVMPVATVLPRAANKPIRDVVDDALSHQRAGVHADAIEKVYPEHAQTLAPLLALSSALRAEAAEPLPAEMEEWVRTAGARDFRAIAEQTLAARRPSLARALPRSATMRRSFASVFVAIVLLSVVDNASAQSLPGQPLYGWKQAREQLLIGLTPTASARGWLSARYFEERVQEVQQLVAQGVPLDSPLVQSTLYGAREHLRAAKSESVAGNTYNEVQPVIDQIASELDEVLDEASATTAEALPPQVAAVKDEIQQIVDAPPVVVAATATASATAVTTDRPSVQPTATAPVVGSINTVTPTNEVVRTPSSTATVSPVASVVATATGANTPTTEATVVATVQPTSDSSEPSLPGQPSEPTPSATSLPVATEPVVSTTVPTNTSVPPTPTEDDGPPATDIPSPNPTVTFTPTPTATPTFTPTVTPTNTLVPPTATDTPTPTNTATPTNTPTQTPEPTDTPTPSDPPQPSETPVSTQIPTAIPVTPTTTNEPTPTPTETDVALAISPILECVVDLPSGGFQAYFGYSNPNAYSVVIGVGDQNYVRPGPIDQGQATEFGPGRSKPFPNAAFSIVSQGNAVVWHLNGRTATASASSAECEVVPTPTATDSVPVATEQITNTIVPSSTTTLTAIPIWTPTATNTPEPTATWTPTATATNTPTTTATNTVEPTTTDTPDRGATDTPLPIATSTLEPVLTDTPEPTSTSTVQPIPTNPPPPADTPLPTATNTTQPAPANTVPTTVPPTKPDAK